MELKILIFRIFLLTFFAFIAYKYGKWNQFWRYYPTMLFVSVMNLFASFITYHHNLWMYQSDLIVKSRTTVEILNSFFALPITTFVFLSNAPYNHLLSQVGYIVLWVGIFSGLEYLDGLVGGITYANKWSWIVSTMFDIALFTILWIHHEMPKWAWILSAILFLVIFIMFDFRYAQVK